MEHAGKKQLATVQQKKVAKALEVMFPGGNRQALESKLEPAGAPSYFGISPNRSSSESWVWCARGSDEYPPERFPR